MRTVLLLLSPVIFVSGFYHGRLASNPLVSDQNRDQAAKSQQLLERLKKVSRKRLMADNRLRSIAFNVDEEPTGVPKPVGSDEMVINEKEGVKDFLFQGDMMLREDQLLEEIGFDGKRIRRNAYKTNVKWNPNSIPYYLDNTLSSQTKERIQKTIKYFEQNTCLKFNVDYNSKPTLKFFHGVGCWSYVGQSTSDAIQEISIGNRCDMHIGVIAHEMLHALGFYHEQSRTDRDNFISVNLNNVNSSNQYLYATEATTDNQDLPYEYGSILHYSAGMFAVDRATPVLYAKDKNHQSTMGNRMVATFQDIQEVNKLYGCLASCDKAKLRPICHNGGYLNPSDCSKCICPIGFGGKQCSELQKPTENSKECGSVILEANSTWSKVSGRMQAGVTETLFEPESCWWRITAPRGQKVLIRVDTFTNVQCNDGCTFNNLEIKVGKFEQTGYRFCCKDNVANEYFYSQDNTMLIGLYAKFGGISFDISYKSA